MNYRHAFHAGNFADVLKHAVLARVLEYMKRKPAPFRVIDTHAGIGRYDLASVEAGKTGEWQAGIGRLMGPDAQPISAPVRALLQPYLDAVKDENGGKGLARYPGSPRLVLRLLRPTDVLVANELHPDDAAALKHAIGRDKRARVLTLDAWVALRAQLPPKERRGLVLIDPPFEQPGEFARLADALAGAHRKWPGGIYLAWYPLKDARESEGFVRKLGRLGIPKILRAEIDLPPIAGTARLRGSGLAIVNPPWTLEAELAVLLPALGTILSAGGKSAIRLDWLAGEK